MAKVGIIGVGRWGVNHLKSLVRIDCELVGISDTNLDRKNIADEHGIRFFTDYKELLQEVDAVTIAVPTDLHYEIVKECLKSGTHVMVEKPLTTRSDRAKELVKIAEDRGLILSVGYLYRFNNSVKRLKELLQEVGEIQYIVCRYIHSSNPPRKDSGVILNLGIHPMDIFNFITDRRPLRVYSKKKNFLSEKLEDSATIVLDYGDFFATIEVSCCHPEKKRDIWIIAEKEKIYVDLFDQRILRYPLRVNYEKIARGDPIEEPIAPNEPLRDELEYFVRLVDDGVKNFSITHNLGKEEYYTTKICELSLKSAQTGKEMVLDD